MRRISTGVVGGPILGALTAFQNTVSGLVTNDDITLTPSGTGEVKINSHLQINSNDSLKLSDSDNSNFVALKSPSTVASDITYTLPGSGVTNGYVLKTDGSGVLSWGEAGIQVADELASSSTHYPLITTSSSGQITGAQVSTTKISFQPSTGDLTVAGRIDAQEHIEVGNGTGSVAMTINDGYGNANLAFNHVNGVPDITGNCARIEVNVDSNTGASMNFEIRSGVSQGVAIQPTTIMNLSESNATFSVDAIPSGTRNLGSTGARWANLYVNDLSLSNGIGDYTVVEGKDDLFLYNNLNGKVYKFLVEEVDPSIAPPKKDS